MTDAPHFRTQDGLRGFLAVWVWLGHCCIRAGLPIPGVEDTRSAVQLFMFLSGFLMAWNHFQEGVTGKEVRAFYIKRFFRLSPLYYAMFLLTAVVGATAIGPLIHQNGVPNRGQVEAHLSYLFGIFPSLASSTALPDWSLSLEMQFYLVFPLLVIAVRRFGDTALLVASILLTYGAERIVSLPESPAHFPLLAYAVPSILPLSLSMFVVGMALANILRAGLGPRSMSTLLAAGAALAFHHNLVVLVVVVLTVLALRHVPAVRAYSSFMASTAVVFLGRISYSVYLLHLPLITLFASLMASEGWFRGVPAYERFAIILLAPAPFVLGLSTIAFHLIERPGIRLGNALVRRSSRMAMSPQ